MHILTGEELAGIMAALSNVRNGIKRLSDETKPGQRYLTDTQLAQELSLSKRTLAKYRAKGEFGYYNLPGKILYAESEIDEFLKRNYLPPFRLTDNAPTKFEIVGALSYSTVILSLRTELGGKSTHLLGD